MLRTISNLQMTSSNLRKLQMVLGAKAYSNSKIERKQYPPMSFTAQYGDEINKRFLNVVNTQSAEEIRRYNITQGRAIQIEKHRQVHGPFRAIDDLLTVDNFGVNILKKLYISIAEGDARDINARDRSTKWKDKLVIPRMDEIQRKQVNTITSIYVNGSDISWAQLDVAGNLIKWNNYGTVLWPPKNAPLFMHELAISLASQLPASDVYVTEGAPLQPTDSYAQRSQLNLMLLALLGTKPVRAAEDTDEQQQFASANIFYFLRIHTTAQLFHLLVGNEKVASNIVLEQIMSNKMSDALTHISPINISHTEKVMYNKSDQYKKEMLSQALLSCIAFLELVIRCNDACFKVISRRYLW